MPHHHPHTDPENLKLAQELGELVRARSPWREALEALPAWHPRNAGDDETGGRDDDRSGGRDDDRDRDTDRDKDRDRDRDADRDRDKGKDKDGDKDKDRDADRDRDKPRGDEETERARQAAARYRRERDELRDQQAEAERKANEAAGKFEELYKTERTRADQLADEVKTLRAQGHAKDALTLAGAKNPTRAMRLLDLKGIEDEHDAEREVRALKQEDPDLFTSGRRQTRRDRDDDERDTRSERDRDDRDRDRDRDDWRDRDRDRDDDRDRDRSPRILGPERIRRGLGKDRDRDRR